MLFLSYYHKSADIIKNANKEESDWFYLNSFSNLKKKHGVRTYSFILCYLLTQEVSRTKQQFYQSKHYSSYYEINTYLK